MANLYQFQLWCEDELHFVEAETIEQAKRTLINGFAAQGLTVDEDDIEEIDASPMVPGGSVAADELIPEGSAVYDLTLASLGVIEDQLETAKRAAKTFRRVRAVDTKLGEGNLKKFEAEVERLTAQATILRSKLGIASTSESPQSSREEMIGELRSAVERAGYRPELVRQILDPQAIDRLNDDELAEFVNRFQEVAAGESELNSMQADATRRIVNRVDQVIQEELDKLRDVPTNPQAGNSAGRALEYQVYVDENSHYMDEAERYSAGVYPDCEVARAACRRIVDDFLVANYKEGMTADELLRLYKSFGEDPWISSPDEDCKFSAWSYAEERCVEICRR